MVGQLSLQEHSIRLAILWLEGYRGSNVEVVEEIGYMQHDRVASLGSSQRRIVFKRGKLTSVTPNSLTVALLSKLPSSASICWKIILSVSALKSSKLGRAHC